MQGSAFWGLRNQYLRFGPLFFPKTAIFGPHFDRTDFFRPKFIRYVPSCCGQLSATLSIFSRFTVLKRDSSRCAKGEEKGEFTVTVLGDKYPLYTPVPYITSNFSSRAFSVSAPSTWNSLPAHIRSIDTLSTYKRHLKFHLFQPAFTVLSSCSSASDSFSRFLALYKYVYIGLRICVYGVRGLGTVDRRVINYVHPATTRRPS